MKLLSKTVITSVCLGLSLSSMGFSSTCPDLAAIQQESVDFLANNQTDEAVKYVADTRSSCAILAQDQADALDILEISATAVQLLAQFEPDLALLQSEFAAATTSDLHLVTLDKLDALIKKFADVDYIDVNAMLDAQKDAWAKFETSLNTSHADAKAKFKNLVLEEGRMLGYNAGEQAGKNHGQKDGFGQGAKSVKLASETSFAPYTDSSVTTPKLTELLDQVMADVENGLGTISIANKQRANAIAAFPSMKAMIRAKLLGTLRGFATNMSELIKALPEA